MAVTQDHRRDRHLALALVGHPDHRRLGDGGVLAERRLHLDREHRVAAVLDHVLLAAGELEHPEAPAAGEVAGAQPAVGGERLVGGARVLPW